MWSMKLCLWLTLISLGLSSASINRFSDFITLKGEISRIHQTRFQHVQIFVDPQSELLDSVGSNEKRPYGGISLNTLPVDDLNQFSHFDPTTGITILSIIFLDQTQSLMPFDLIQELPKRFPTHAVWIFDLTGNTITFSQTSLKLFIDNQLYLVDSSPASQNQTNLQIREIIQIPGLKEPILRKIGTFKTDTNTIHPLYSNTWNRDNFFARRKDLWGITLKFLVEESKPYCFILHDTNGTNPIPYGIYIDILRLFSKEFNFTMTFTRAPQNSWTEMIRLLTLEEYDGIGVDVAINKERAALVDFTSPIFWSDYRLVSQAPNQALSYTTYLSTFSFQFWSAFIANIVICSVALFAVIRIERSQCWAIWECLSMVCLAMVCIGLSHLPSRISSRVLFLSVLLLGTVMWASYQASLTSTLTVVQSSKAISDLNDVFQLDFEIGLWTGTVVEQVMKLSPENSVAKILYETKIKPNPKNHLNNENGFERVRMDSKFAYLTVTTETIYSPYYPCDIIQSHISTFKFPSGLAFRPGFELLPLFNHYLAKLMQSGQYERFRHQHLPRAKSCPPKDLTLGFDNIISAFLLLAVGVLTALILAGSEKVRVLISSQNNLAMDSQNEFRIPFFRSVK